MLNALVLVRDDLRRFEGFREKAYKDADGYAIGYGFTYITEEEANFILYRRIRYCAEACRRKFGRVVWVRLDPVRQAVCMEMVYQLGGFSEWPKFVKAVIDARYEDAAEQMLYVSPDTGNYNWSSWHQQTTERCVTLARWMKEGERDGTEDDYRVRPV